MRFDVVQHIAARADPSPRHTPTRSSMRRWRACRRSARRKSSSHEVDGETVRLRIRYRYVAELSSVVRTVVDPAKLSWVEVSTHRLADREVTFRMDPDHYADRFQSSGSSRFDASGDGTSTARRSSGEVSIRVRLVGGASSRRSSPDCKTISPPRSRSSSVGWPNTAVDGARTGATTGPWLAHCPGSPTTRGPATKGGPTRMPTPTST